MDITTKQAKRLKYLARCYSDSTYTTINIGNGKVKHRDYPSLGISYNEKTCGNGVKVLSNIKVSGNPFHGSFDELVTIIECGNPQVTPTPDLKAQSIIENIRETLTASETAIKLTCGDSPIETAENVIKENVPDGCHVDVDGKQEDGIVKISAHAVITNKIDQVNVEIKVPPVEEPKVESVSDPFGELTGEVNPTFTLEAPVEELKTKTIIVTGPVCPERHDSGRDFSGLSLEPIDEATAEKIHKDLEEAKQVAEETGTPVITAVQNPPVHIDSAAEGVKDVSAIIDTSEITAEPVQPRKPTMAELIDLRMRCATIRLAEAYGESPGISIGDLMRKYPGAVTDFNDFLYGDGVKPYTISEESIQKAYPREYVLAIKKEGN